MSASAMREVGELQEAYLQRLVKKYSHQDNWALFEIHLERSGSIRREIVRRLSEHGE